MGNTNADPSHIHDETVADEKAAGGVITANTSSMALTSAIASQKPNLLSVNMLKLYFIMGVGYLVSTMNGFGT
jgi:hypothetical protein